MSEREFENQQAQYSQVEKIASQTTAKQYFLNEENDLLNQWGQKSSDLFKFTADIFMKEYQLKSSHLSGNSSVKFQDLYSKCRKQFEAYCILNRKVQKKNDQIENFASFFNFKNHKKTFFNAWKQLAAKQKYLRAMQQKSQKYKQMKTLKNCLKAWNEQTMKSNRLKIKNEVLHKTQIEITKVQQQYQKIIKTLQETLEKKLTELKKQQQEHKLLHDKYETMYARNKIQS